MRFVVTKEHLAKGLQAVSRAVSARGPLPILTHLKLDALADELVLTATDLEIGLEARIPATVSEPGALALNAKTLGEIVSKLPSADIELATGQAPTEVVLKCLRSKFTLRGMPAVEFPALPAVDNAERCELGAEELARGIRQTLFAAAGEDKAVISGLFVQLQGPELELVATDGYRLAWRQATVEPSGADLSVVVPRRAMDELSRQIAASGSERVTVAFSHNQIRFTLADRYMTSRLLEGQFPPYRQIIPTTFEREGTVDRATWLAAVERVSIMASDREAHIIKLEFEDQELRLSAGTAELGESVEVVPIAYTGEPLAIIFNAGFLSDALKHIEAETVRVKMNGSLAPALVRPEGSDEHTCLLMPLNRM